MQAEIVGREEWLKRRLELLAQEKEFTRQRDALFRKRSQLPWVLLDKDYQFQSTQGPLTLGQLFQGQPQLIVYHFMYGPDMGEACPSCTLIGDHFVGLSVHLRARNVQLAMVSRGPLDRLMQWKARFGWDVLWVSSADCDFNRDFQVTFAADDPSPTQYNYQICEGLDGEMPGLSVFAKDEQGRVYHTYSNYGRGLEDFMTVYRFLDVVPRGRDEDQLDYGMQWVRYRDQYGSPKSCGSCECK